MFWKMAEHVPNLTKDINVQIPRYMCECKFLFLWDQYPGGIITRLHGKCMFNFISFQTFTELWCHPTFPPAVCKRRTYSLHSSPALCRRFWLFTVGMVYSITRNAEWIWIIAPMGSARLCFYGLPGTIFHQLINIRTLPFSVCISV